MKTLTYKILKEETEKSPKVEFNKEFFTFELIKEIGLTDVPYDKLGDYKVQLNSPTGRSSSFSVNAKEYVDNELINIETNINEHNNSLENDPQPTFDIVTIHVDEKQEALMRKTIEGTEDFWEWVETKEPIKEIKMDQAIDNFKYYDVRIPDTGALYTVIIYNDGSVDIRDQINLVRKHVCTVGERRRDLIIGTETIINYYQWVNLVSQLELKPKEYLTFEDISERMDTIFQGVEGVDLPAGF